MYFMGSSIVATLLLAAAVVAQETFCDGGQRPDWNDCRAIMAPYSQNSGSYPAPGEGQCTVLFGAVTQNCEIILCPNANIPIRAARVDLAFTILESFCDSNDAGGTQTVEDPDGFTLTAKFNPDYLPPTLEPSSARNATSRVHARDVLKRQQESDTEYELGVKLVDITRPGEVYDIGPPIPGGSSQTREVTESMEFSLTTGVSFSAGIEAIFSASVNVELQQSYGVTNTMGVMIVVNCDPNRQGQIQWEPLWDRYDGFFRPSGEFSQVWIPTGEGQYSFRCLG